MIKREKKIDDVKLYDVGCLGILAGAQAEFLIGNNFMELLFGIFGVIVYLIIVFQWKSRYKHRLSQLKIGCYSTLLVLPLLLAKLIFIDSKEKILYTIISIVISIIVVILLYLKIKHLESIGTESTE